MMKLVKAGSNWVAGDRFFNRGAETEALMERVQDGETYAADSPASDGQDELGSRTVAPFGRRGEL